MFHILEYLVVRIDTLLPGVEGRPVRLNGQIVVKVATPLPKTMSMRDISKEVRWISAMMQKEENREQARFSLEKCGVISDFASGLIGNLSKLDEAKIFWIPLPPHLEVKRGGGRGLNDGTVCGCL
jgi:hypothetical protein